jgi:hypothetical protein
MGPIVSKIFKQICAPGELTLVERLDTNQALLKQLSKILDAVFKLDEFKMIHSGMSPSACYAGGQRFKPHLTPGFFIQNIHFKSKIEGM